MKLAIVGAEEHTRHLAPFDDPDFDIWVFNEFAAADWCKRWSGCFQIHQPKVYRDPKNEKDPKHWAWLQQEHGKPIFMQAVDPQVPDSVKYPLEEINETFLSTLTYEGLAQKRNYRATLAYAMALGLYKGYEEIDIWGVELAHYAEYRSQQTNFAFWVGLATGRGVKVDLHCCKGMFDQPLYGYEDFMEEDKIQRYLEGIRQQIAEEKEKLNKLQGAEMLAVQMLAERGEQEQGAEAK